ncbi:MAG TPA: AsmA family protein [Syntrophorhabdales bacterium]|nr:AsmA family protein [Syntrophorhabdales bacterium]
MIWKRALIVAIVVVLVLVSVVWVIIATYDYNKLKPQIASAFKEATGRELSLKGNLDLKVGLQPTLVVNDAALQNASWGSRPEMAEIKRFEIQLSLIPLIFRHIAVKRIVLVSPDILVETKPTGESNLDFLTKMSGESGKKGKPSTTKVELSVNQMSIQDGRLTYRDGKTGKTYSLVLARLDASASGPDSPLKLDLHGLYNGKSFEVTGNLVPLASFTDATRPWPLKVNVSAGGATIGLDGTIRDVANAQGLDLKVAVKIKDAAGLGDFLDEPLPVKGPIELSCRVTDPRPKTYAISELKLAAAGSDLEGSLAMDLSKTRPALTADLQSKKIDLRPLAGNEKATPKKKAGERVFPDTPLPLAPLQLVDARVSLRASDVFTPQIALHDLDAKVTLVDGHLSVAPLTALIGGGRLDARLDLKPVGKAAQMATLVTVKQLDAGAMLRELKESEMIDGRLDARVDVTGSGESIAGIMAGLNGMVYVIMGEGKINNKYLGLLGGDISSSVLRMINPFKKEAPYTAVSCMVYGFKITNGMADTTAFVLNTETMSVVGNGTINLRTEGLDLSMNPVPKEGVGTGITGKFSLNLGELTKPFKLAGTLAHPSLGVDFKQAALTAGKAVGGFMLLGPIGLGSALVGSSSGEKQLCPMAVKAAEQGVKLNLSQQGQSQGVVGKTTQGVEKGIGAVTKGLKGLFGK